MQIHVQNSKVVYIKVRFLEVVSSWEICYKNVQSNQDFGRWMYFQISLSLWALQEIRDMLLFVKWKIVEKSLSRFFLLLIFMLFHLQSIKKTQLLRRIWNPLKYLWWSFFTKTTVNDFQVGTIFALFHFYKSSIIDFWYGCKYASEL